MKKIILAIALVTGLAAPALAQTDEEKRDKKLKEEWLVKGGWITDYDKARAESKKEGKPIFAYFTRSYSF